MNIYLQTFPKLLLVLFRVRLSTIGLLVLTSFESSFYGEYFIYLRFITSRLYEEVKCTEPSPSVSVPCFNLPSSLTQMENIFFCAGCQNGKLTK
jgi:hypothetical protein